MYFNRGVNSFLKLGGGASSNAARHCPAAPSILPKSGGDNCPPPFIDAPESNDPRVLTQLVNWANNYQMKSSICIHQFKNYHIDFNPHVKFVFTDVCCYRRKFCNCECRSESDWKLNANAFKDCQPCPDTPPDPPCRVKTIE